MYNACKIMNHIITLKKNKIDKIRQNFAVILNKPVWRIEFRNNLFAFF